MFSRVCSPRASTFAAATAAIAAGSLLLQGAAQAAGSKAKEPTVKQILASQGAVIGTNTFLDNSQTFSFASGGHPFGFYIDNTYVSPGGAMNGGTFYSQTGLDSDGYQHVHVYQEQGTTTDFLAFEDKKIPPSDKDFNDLVVEYNTKTGELTKLASFAAGASATSFGYYDSVTGAKTFVWNDSVPNGTTANISPVPEASTLVGFGFGGLALIGKMIRGRKKSTAA